MIWSIIVISLTISVLMDGIAIICLGFVSFGCLHIRSTSVEPWQWYVPSISTLITAMYSHSSRVMIIFGIVTVLSSVAFWYFAQA